jgi:hypothetical protein
MCIRDRNTFLAQTGNGGSTAGLFSVINDAVDDTVQKNVRIVTSSEEAVGNGFGASLEFALQPTTGIVAVTTSSIKSSWQNATAQNSKLELTTAAAGVESSQIIIESDGDVFLDKYGDGTKVDTPTKTLGVISSGKIVESPVPFYHLIILKATHTNGGVLNYTTIVNTAGITLGTQDKGAGLFSLGVPGLKSTGASVLVQNGNPGSPTARVGTVYAQADTDVVDFRTYNDVSALSNAILNDAIIEIKIFP